MEEAKEALLPQSLEDYAMEFLKEGREGWDVPHTRSVVEYARQIAFVEKLDVKVLEATAWLHDVGYYQLFDGDSNSPEDIKKRKPQHMENSARVAKEFLERPENANTYTPEQKERIIHLIRVHDTLDVLKNPDEIAFMEADTLGMIDVRRVTPTFTDDKWQQHVKGVKLRRISRFQTETGKKLAQEVLPFAEAYRGNST